MSIVLSIDFRFKWHNLIVVSNRSDARSESTTIVYASLKLTSVIASFTKEHTGTFFAVWKILSVSLLFLWSANSVWLCRIRQDLCQVWHNDFHMCEQFHSPVQMFQTNLFLPSVDLLKLAIWSL